MKGNAIRQGRIRTANNLTKPQARLGRRVASFDSMKGIHTTKDGKRVFYRKPGALK